MPLWTDAKAHQLEFQQANPTSYEALMQNINMANIRETMALLSSIDSRIVGSAGYVNASNFINDTFTELGLEDVTSLKFDVTAPVTNGANLTITGPQGLLVLPLHPMEPNQAHPCMTPPEGIEGRLIYAGDGRFEDVQGKNLEGTIAILNFNCQHRWLDLAEFGAEALIFIEPDFTTPFEARSKSVDAPLNIPRFYVTKDEAETLMRHLNATVRIKSYVQSENLEACNIIGYLPGTDDSLKDEIISISARYDSYSVVLDMAPGADMSSGISVLIELARFFKENRPPHPLLFVAFSGQQLGLAGARDFAERFIWGDYWEIYGRRISLLVNLDLSVEEAAIFGLSESYFYRSSTFNGNWEWVRDELFTKYLDDIEGAWKSLYQRTFPVYGFRPQRLLGINVVGAITDGTSPTLIPEPYATDSEPFSLTGGSGISIYTPLTSRSTWRTPLDTYDRISENGFENLQHQAEYLMCVFYSIVNEGHYDTPISLAAERESGRWRRSSYEGFATLVGQTVMYDQTSGLYAPVPNVTVVLTNPMILDPTFISGVYDRTNILRVITKSGNDGIFTIEGLQTAAAGRINEYHVQAYAIGNNGSISYASDLGQYGAGRFPNRFLFLSADVGLGTDISPRYFTVFQCGALNLFNVELPEIMRNPGLPDQHALKAFPVALEILDHRTHYLPLFYGYTVDLGSDVAMAFAPPDTPIDIIIRNEWTTRLIGVLTNASKGNEEGTGYQVKAGETFTVDFTSFNVARDLYLLDDYRIASLTEYGIGISQVSSSLHAEAEDYLNEAMTDLPVDAVSSWVNVKKVLLHEYKIYPETLGMLKDVVQTAVFFFVLLIPFALVCERFILQGIGKKRILAIICMFVLGIFPMYLFHPSFRLASNILALLVGCLVFVMMLPVLGTVASKVSSIFSALRKRLIGYEVEISRFSVFSLSVSVGIQNMRRRKLRSSMALISIILATFGVTLTSAFTPISVLRLLPRPAENPYEGIMIRQDDSRVPLSESVYQFTKYQLPDSAVVSARAALYPPSLDFPPLWVESESGKYRVYSLWGVTSGEFELGIVKTALTPESRWIEDFDYLSCLIPLERSEELNVGIGDKVHLYDLELTVIGFFQAQQINRLIDLDGEAITPRDVRRGEDETVHVYGEYVVVLPLRLVSSLGGYIYSISIMLDDESQIHNLASEFADQFGVTKVIVGLGNQIFVYTAVGVVALTGGISAIVPLILCALMIFSILLGGVYERTREISIYSSLGLSPLSVGGLFISESTVYALLGSGIGYDLGIVTTVLARNLGWVTEEFSFNLTSLMVIYAILVMFTCIYMSSIYPLYAASKLVTPSLERKWKMPSSAKGDIWNIPLPFTFKSKEESIGALVFLEKYFGVHTSEEVGDFVASDSRLSSETVDDKEAYSLEGRFRLAPYPGNIEQHVKCITAKFAPDRWTFNIFIERSSGHPKLWRKVNYSYVNEIRRRLMAWASLRTEERMEFISEGEKRLGI